MNIQIRRYDVLDSTNELIVELAKQGAAEGTVVVAKEQHGGHGRKQRKWQSPVGGLWFSILFRPKIESGYVAQLTLLAGVAVAKALRDIYRTNRIRIKWPNDLFLEGKKVGGILSEMRLNEHGGVDYAIVGIGVNVNLSAAAFQAELRDTANSLKLAFGQEVPCDKVLQTILKEIIVLYEAWQRKGTKRILSMWKNLNCTLGHMVTVKDEGHVIFEGKAVSIDHTGALMVQTGSGSIRSFDFGEVSIRPT